MEELQEADVLWPDAAHRHLPEAQHHHDCRRRQHLTDDQQPRRRAETASAGVQMLRQSPPVRIPSMPHQQVEARTMSQRHPWTRSYYDECGNEDDDGDVRGASPSGAEAGIVPPHVLAARRCADERRVASSVCVGHGRTLKGRDLRAVRNAVLHMTGFLSSSDDKYYYYY